LALRPDFVRPLARATMESPRKHLRVLVVDDDYTRESFRAILDYWGYVVGHAATGPDAIFIASDCRPAVVFLDVRIRGSNVYEVIRSLNHLPLKPFIAVVSANGLPMPEQIAY
jgi:CheY-like chemotaxis protein